MNTNLVFSKARYLSGEKVVVSIDKNVQKDIILQRENIIIEDYSALFQRNNGKSNFTFSNLEVGSYILTIEDYQGSFVIEENVNDSVLYGFLSDFENPSDGKEIASLSRLHINTVQFYDWMYRHDDLISKDEEYFDPLNRKINLSVIKDKVARCKASGMRAFAYGAIYAATDKIYETYPSWCLYKIDKKPLKFANWLYYMNISQSNGWSDYITNEFVKAVKKIGFDGIHMDTYGFPKTGCDYNGNIVFLDDEIPHLMDKIKKSLKKESLDTGIIFNAVNDWPTETVSKCSDAAYIEVWSPHDSYYDLYLLIKKAKLLGHENVVLACYDEPFKKSNQEVAENAWRLTFATINSSGGTQLIMGENKAVLSNSYYADYSTLRDSFVPITIRYFDFIVAYKNMLYKNKGMDVSLLHSGGINEDIIFKSKGVNFSPVGLKNSVWTIIKETKNIISCQFINLLNNNSLWNKAKNTPPLIEDVIVKIRLNRFVKNVWLASPDLDDIRPFKLDFTYDIIEEGRLYSIKITNIEFWTMVVVEME